jgi:hypothetical protein
MRVTVPFLLMAALAAPAAAQEAAAPAAPSPEAAAWSDFCRRLEQAGHAVLEAGAPAHPEDRGAGLRYLAEQVAAAVDREVIAGQTALPLLRVNPAQLHRWGMDGADAKYLSAHVDGSGRYRVHGRLGSARLVALQLFRSEPRFEAFASLSGEALGAAADGRFELLLSREKPAGHEGAWLALDPRATDLLVREYFADWNEETVSELAIERLDAAAPAPPLGPEQAAALLTRIADTFTARAPMWLPRNQPLRANLVNRMGPPLAAEGQGLGDNVYGAGWYSLAPDQALVIELEPPAARLWSFQLGNVWWESADFITRTGSLNGEQVFVSSDGRVRLVVSLEDPGVPNWLDPAGHREGQILYRYQGATSTPLPSAQLVKRADLATVLPADTPRVGAAERRQEIAARRAHAARRWGP